MKFGLINMLLRWLLIAGVLLATYNPSGRSFAHWVGQSDTALSFRLALGFLLASALAFFVQLTFRSLGYPGVSILAITITTVAVSLVQLGLVTPVTSAQWITFGQLVVATALTIGVSWSSIRTRLAGQVDSDDVSKRL
jgi:hypothetical protein